MIPAILIAAPASGSGKTTVVCAIAAALKARGLDVRTFKAGPDYLDPTWHRVVTGRSSRNLDGWMTGRDGVRASFARGAEGGDIALIEGVMGLFDGRSPRSLEGSGAEIALWLGIPVVVVVDASGMARTAAAVVAGLAGYQPGVQVAGVVFNRVGSVGHGKLLAEAMEAGPWVEDVPSPGPSGGDGGGPREARSGDRGSRPPAVLYLGSLGRRDDIAVPERHLGLVSGEIAARPGWVEALATWGETLDLDGLLAIARKPGVAAPEVPAPHDGSGAAGARSHGGDALAPSTRAGDARASSTPAGFPPKKNVRIGIARDAAFHFYYEDNLDLLREAGAELVPFSPLADAGLPADLDGLYLGGGYPEEHRATLSGNLTMRAAIRVFPGVIYAECGGLMFLGETLDEVPMCGVLPVRTRMTGRLRTLGYREVTLTADTPLGPAGTVFRGHEFHYSELADTPDVSPVYRMTGRGGEGVEGWARGRVLGSYVHAHFGSNPVLATNLVAACAR